MNIRLTPKAKPEQMRRSPRRALVITMRKLASQAKVIPIDSLMRAVRVPQRKAQAFKKRLRVLRREGFIRTLAA